MPLSWDWLPGSSKRPPGRKPPRPASSSACAVGPLGAVIGHDADGGDRTLLFLAARHFQRDGGNLERVMPGRHQQLDQFALALAAAALEPDFDRIHQPFLAVDQDIILGGQSERA